ncbi:MAG: acetyltransferase [Eubacteriales bacterium]|nr:acetyltransferase [Eubacteriales bacterium]
MKKIIIIGAGGNSKVIIDIILSRIELGEKIQIMGILDDDENKKSLTDYPVLGPVSRISTFRENKEIYFVNGVGDNHTRKRIYETYSIEQYYTAVHPSAIIGSRVTIEQGCVIMAGVIINAGCSIGKQALINTGAIIEHDNRIGAFAHVASGAVTAGNVTVGECSMLGTGTKVIQGISIGSCVMIGAGAVVIGDIRDNATAVGVPVRIIK